MSARNGILMFVAFMILYMLDSDKTEKTKVSELISFYQESVDILANQTSENRPNACKEIRDELSGLFPKVSLNTSRFHQNISGFINGRFTTQNTTTQPISSPKFNPIILSNDSIRNGLNDSVLNAYSISIDSNRTAFEDLYWIKGFLTINSKTIGVKSTSFDSFKYKYSGIYIAPLGELYLTAYDEMFIPLDGISDLIIHPKYYDMSVNATVERLKDQISVLNELSKKSETIKGLFSSNYSCSFRGFIKLNQLPSLNIDQDMESSYPLIASSLLYSPECGVLLKSDSSRGLTDETYVSRGQLFAFILSMITLLQIIISIRQMETSSTPSALVRTSHVSVIMQIVLDASTCLALMTNSVQVEGLFGAFIGCAFMQFILFSIFELKYGIEITRVRQDMDQANFIRIYLYLAVLFMLMYQMAVQIVLVGLCLTFIFYCFWIPQIFKNFQKNSNKAFSWKYVIFMSASRLFVPFYLLGYSENIFNYGETYPIALTFLLALISLQVLVLYLQDKLGPRACIPARFLPQTYNYHPLLGSEVSDIEASTSSTLNKECAICFSDVDTQVAKSIFQVEYMVTPCHHLFHTECLKTWMDIKLECPVCRAELPIL